MKTKYLYSLIGIFSLVLLSSILGLTMVNSEKAVTEEIPFEGGVVTVKLNGEIIQEEHNLLYTAGKNAVRDALGENSATLPYQNISLCNATAGCSNPVVAGSETYNELSSCNLSSASGTYSSTGTGNWTVERKFISTCDSVSINATRLTNANGDLFAGSAIDTQVNMDTDDELTITWNPTVS